ncbi:MAG TPA: hypothetical protein VGN20_21560 [Mucilaginibacter sp.]
MTKSAKFSLVLLLFAAIATSATKAQEFGGNPPSIKWLQINTPTAKVIFPVGLDSAGLRVANIVQQMNKAIQSTIGFKQKQISILLQNQTTIANAYVGLAPFRSEFYLTPEQNSFDIGSLPWAEQLAIHEFRHVQQYNNFNVGFSHILKIIFGEGGQALANDVAIPNWFFEGDAVFNETLVSEQGRGRLPFFLNGYRALWAAQKDYSYMKLRNGSYLDYVPDWYPLGYMMVSYGREKYGDDFWKKVTHDAAAYKGVFYPLQKAIKRYSDHDFKTFADSGFNYFKRQFNDRIGDVAFQIPRHFVADMEYPAYVNDSTLVYLKSTYDHRSVFCIKTGNHERDISVRDFSLDNYFGYRDGKIVYASYRPDLRWNYRDYSELVMLDVKTGKEHRITKNTKYFAPDFSADGRTIVTVKEGTDGKCDIHLVNASDGKLISVIPNGDNLFYTYPKFYGNDKIISAVRNKKGEMSLAEIGIKTGEVKYLLPFSYKPIAFPFVKNDKVYFSTISDVDDVLFAFDLITGKLSILDDPHKLYGEIGNYETAIGDKKIAWVWFSAVGYAIHETDYAKLKWVEIEQKRIPGSLPDFGVSALKRDSSTDLLSKVKNDSLTISKYHKFHHLLNFHSLIPNFNDPNYTLSLAGENVLNTMQTNLSFTYNSDEGYKRFGFDAVYGALFPYISGGADYTLDRRTLYNGSNVYWNETNLHGGLQLPLNFTRGKHSTFLQIGGDLYYSQTLFQPAYKDMFHNTSFAYSNNYITFSNAIQKAKQNIFPRLAQTISLNYKTAISGIDAYQFLASGYFYFPGITINQNLVLNIAHQQKNKGGVINFSNDFPFSRGYIAENLNDMNKAGVNYHFPIAYPDAGLANTIYFLRIRGNAFYDFTNTNDYYSDGRPFKGTFRSTGAELYFDTKVFNQGSVSFGFRYSYLIDRDVFGGTGRNRFEIIVPITAF